MEFGRKKYGVLVLERRKLFSSEGVEMPHIKRINEGTGNGYKYLVSFITQQIHGK